MKCERKRKGVGLGKVLDSVAKSAVLGYYTVVFHVCGLKRPQ